MGTKRESFSLLITGGTGKSREEKLGEVLGEYGFNPAQADPDLIYFAGRGVEDVRDLEKILALRPTVHPVKIIIISQADTLTEEAQNALLKSLEEPPEQTVIVLGAPDEDLLLPTVVSRCFVLSLSDLRNLSDLNDLSDFLSWMENGNVTAGFAWAEKMKDRPAAIALTDELLKRASPRQGQTLTSSIRKLLQAKRYLQANTNVRLTLENLFIKE